MITLKPILRTDDWGNGEYGAPRGVRTHNGIDYAVGVCSLTNGVVSKIGRPYYSEENPEKNYLRYVQVTSPLGYQLRYFYIEPSVSVGDKLATGDIIGVVADVSAHYKGMKNHIHFEIIKDGKHINPELYFKEFGFDK